MSCSGRWLYNRLIIIKHSSRKERTDLRLQGWWGLEIWWILLQHYLETWIRVHLYNSPSKWEPGQGRQTSVMKSWVSGIYEMLLSQKSTLRMHEVDPWLAGHLQLRVSLMPSAHIQLSSWTIHLTKWLRHWKLLLGCAKLVYYAVTVCAVFHLISYHQT